MRRLIIIVIVAVLALFIISKVLCKSKGGAVKGVRKGKTSGEIVPRTKAQITAEKNKAKKEERARKKELRRRQRAERLARRGIGRYGNSYGYGSSRMKKRGYTGGLFGARTGRKSNVALYKLGAIITIDNNYYALIDGRQYSVGDYIQGRKIVEILNDRIILDEMGRKVEVKIGQSVNPTALPRSSEPSTPSIIPKIGDLIKPNINITPNVNESAAPNIIPSKIKDQIKF